MHKESKAVPPKAAYGHDIMTKKLDVAAPGTTAFWRIDYTTSSTFMEEKRGCQDCTICRQPRLCVMATPEKNEEDHFQRTEEFSNEKNCKKDYGMVSAIDRVPFALLIDIDSK